MKHINLAVGILIIFLAAGIAVVYASKPEAGNPINHGIEKLTQTQQLALQEVPRWQQLNSNGFGDQGTAEVSALEAFNGQLYAGTSNSTNFAQIFRSPDGIMWTPVTQPGFGIPHDTAPPAILDMMVFNGYLYASTGRGDGPGQIWRALDGVNWAPMVIHGFSDPDTVDITALAEYRSLIYAGATNLNSGAQIWRSFTGDNNTWTQVAPAVSGTAAASVTGFAEFDGALYAAIESDSPTQIWRSYGSDWTAVISDGFGNSRTTLTGGMAVFAGYLYVGAGNIEDGALLYRTNDGIIWVPAIIPGFGDMNNKKVEMVFVFENHLYASVKNPVTGIEIWRSTNGTLWEQANQDGFGDSNNSGSNWSNATADFLGQVYVGTSNAVDGGELWRMLQPFGVNLSPDDTLAGLAGQSVAYTLWITNTGTLTDTFNLSVAGNTWTTVLSSPTILLAPGDSNTFAATITIPVNAHGNTVDTVTLTATSQGDLEVKDSAILTTSCLSSGQKFYLPVILWSSLSQPMWPQSGAFPGRLQFVND